MRGEVGFLVAAYAIFWIALLVYVGWIALRLRGLRTDIEAVRDLLEEREHATEQPAKHE
jgi:hypothetical protein